MRAIAATCLTAAGVCVLLWRDDQPPTQNGSEVASMPSMVPASVVTVRPQPDATESWFGDLRYTRFFAGDNSGVLIDSQSGGTYWVKPKGKLQTALVVAVTAH